MLILLTVVFFLGLLLVMLALRRMVLVFAALFLYRTPPHSTGAVPPRFIVFCACRNEKRNLDRLIKGLDALSYAPDRLDVVLIDDNSDDGSAQFIESAAAQREHWEAILFNDQIRRGKAQALTEALSRLTSSHYDLALVLDADHVLDTQALYRLADYFTSPSVGAVALYHDVVNRECSFTAVYCYLEDAVNEAVTSRGQHALKLNARLAGVFSARFSLLKLHYPGGWNIGDDADLTARLCASGSNISFAADVRSRHFVPQTASDYIGQHLRWAGGLYQSSRKNLPLFFSSRGLPLPLRVEAIISNLGYFERPLMASYVACAAVAAVVAGASPLLMSLPLALTLAAALFQIVSALWLTKAGIKLWFFSFGSLSMAVLDLVVSVWALVKSISGTPISWTEAKPDESFGVVRREADR